MGVYQIQTDGGTYEITTEEPSDTHPQLPDTGQTLQMSPLEKTASVASSLVTPPTQPQQGFLDSIKGAAKDLIAPTWDSVKRFFTPVAGQFGPSRFLEQQGQKVGQAVDSSVQNIETKYPITQALPQTAGPLGVAKMMSHSLTPSSFQQQLGAEGLGQVVLKPAMEALATELKSISNKAAESSFGFNKTVLNKVRGGTERAAEASGAMMDQGAMGAFSSPKTMLDRVSAIKQAAGDHMSAIQSSIDASGQTPLNAGDIAKKIEDQIMPDVKGGIADRLRNSAQNVIDTVLGNGDGPVTFDQMMKVKKVIDPGRWGDAQMAALGEDAKKVFQMRQQAAAIIGKEMDNAVAASLPADQASAYTAAKDVYGKASEVSKALTDKVDRIAGRRFFDLPSSTIGAGGLAASLMTHNPAVALGTGLAMGGEKYLETYGPQQAALALRGASGALSQGVPVGGPTAIQGIIHNYLSKNAPKGSQAPSNFFEAIKKASENLKSEMVNPGGPGGVSQAQSMAPMPRMSEDQAAFRSGLQSFLNNDLQGAKNAWLDAVKLNPSNLEARRGLERIAQKEGKDPDAYKARR